MMRIVDCLTLEHDLSLVLLAALICVLGCTACVAVAARALSGTRPLLWMSLLGTCAGCTVWSTHFVAMLAYQTSVPITYDPVLTILSLIVGTGAMSIGFTLGFRFREHRRLRLAGGIVVGASVAALHYIGMAGLRFPGTMHYDTDLVLYSLIATAVFGALAIDRLYVASSRLHLLLAGLLMVLMIVSLHFLGMSAARMELGFFDAGEGASRTTLITGVTLASLVVLAIGFTTALIDQRMSRQLATQAARFRMLADGAFEGLIVLRGTTIIDTNLAARQLLDIDQQTASLSIDDWHIPAMQRLPIGHAPIIQEIQVRSDNGCDFPAEICRRAILLQDGSAGEMIAIRDLTQRKESEAKIAHLALHDSLTDLPNRRFFQQLSDSAITHARRTEGAVALLAIDLDNFKTINDMHGHGTGDELIQQVASRLNAIIERADVLARQGGDEFSILCTSRDQPAAAFSLAQRIHAELEGSMELDGAQVMVNASIGVAIYPGDGESLETLMRNADTAMYAAKAQGKSTTRFFKPMMNEQLEQRRLLESRLKQALSMGTLSMNYQPLISCDDSTTVCFEALLRWNDPELGPVSPADFIPVAEQTGLIGPIGEFVLQQACRDASSWPEHIHVAVNLSVAQFDRCDLVGMVRRILHETGLPAKRLELEITESLLIDNKDEAVATLDELRAMGIRIAMDDFGTGYSSLSYLQSFNFNKIKIDRAFVSDLEKNPQNASIVQAVVSMGKSLQMRVVAEGVETHEQASILAGLSCDELQGFLISRPMPAADVADFIANSPALFHSDAPNTAKAA